MKIVKVISLSFCLCFQTKFDNQVFQIFLKNADNFGWGKINKNEGNFLLKISKNTLHFQMMKICTTIAIQKDVPMQVIHTKKSPLSEYKEFRAYMSGDLEYLTNLDNHLEK